MKILEKIKSYFSNKKASDDSAVQIIADAIDNLKKVNTELKNENKALHCENKKLRDTILTMQMRIDALEKTGFSSYTTSSTYTLPKQEPIRAYKPKRNRNNHKKYYKKEDKVKNELPIEKHRQQQSKPKRRRNSMSFIKSEDIPKPGSHDRIVLHG